MTIKQRGFSLPAAIFIMIALAAIGVAMVSLNSVSTTTSVLSIEQSRAYYAAQSAMEWAIISVLNNDNAVNDSCNNVSGSGGLSSLDGFQITITCPAKTCPDSYCCDKNIVNDCLLNPRVTVIKAIAEKNSGNNFHVKREIEATVSFNGL